MSFLGLVGGGVDGVQDAPGLGGGRLAVGLVRPCAWGRGCRGRHETLLHQTAGHGGAVAQRTVDSCSVSTSVQNDALERLRLLVNVFHSSHQVGLRRVRPIPAMSVTGCRRARSSRRRTRGSATSGGRTQCRSRTDGCRSGRCPCPAGGPPGTGPASPRRAADPGYGNVGPAGRRSPGFSMPN